MEDVKKDEHLCPYCRKNKVKDPNEDRLCGECSEMFGHSFYSEL
jgi:ribosomal protein L37AE/L43A